MCVGMLVGLLTLFTNPFPHMASYHLHSLFRWSHNLLVETESDEYTHVTMGQKARFGEAVGLHTALQSAEPLFTPNSSDLKSRTLPTALGCPLHKLVCQIGWWCRLLGKTQKLLCTLPQGGPDPCSPTSVHPTSPDTSLDWPQIAPHLIWNPARWKCWVAW